jgi:capsular polysaccharide biosynthesis protein
VSFSRQQLVDLWRQWPWIQPRGTEPSAIDWVRRAQQQSGWYAGLRGNWHEAIYPGGVLVNPPPVDLPAAARAEFQHVASRRYPVAEAFHLTGASLVGDQGMVVTPDNRLLAEFHHRFTGPQRPPASALLDLHPRRFDHPVALLAVPEARNHYHWLFDALPRVHLLQRWRDVIEYYAVPAGLSIVQLETLQLLGIDRTRLLELPAQGRVRCQHLYVTSLPGSEGCYAPWARDFLRTAFQAAARATAGVGARIYLHRGAKAKRPVLNETELAGRLERRGFQIVSLENRTFLEQVAIFRDARTIVAAHGAGLANLAFAGRAAVLELFSQDYLRPDCYFTLCRQAGHAYDCWLDPQRPGAARPWGAISVDCAAVERKIDALEQISPAT